MKSPRSFYAIFIVLLFATVFLAACERPLQLGGDTVESTAATAVAVVGEAATAVAPQEGAAVAAEAGGEASTEEGAAAPEEGAAAPEEGAAAPEEGAATAETSAETGAESSGEGELAGTPHIVQEGETLFDIAAHYKISWVTVAEHNGIVDINTIRAGTIIYIPPVEAEAAAAEGDGTTSEEGEAAAEGEAPAGIAHTILEGETLFDIAAQYDVSWVKVAEYNSIADVSQLTVGAIILIPPVEAEAAAAEGEGATSAEGEAAAEGEAPAGIAHTVLEGETLFDIAAQYDVSWVKVAEYNAIADVGQLTVGAIILIPPVEAEAGAEEVQAATEVEAPAEAPAEIAHVVAEGETLFDIAAQYDVSWVTVAQLNAITDLSQLQVGATILIPPKEEAAAEEGAAGGESSAEGEAATEEGTAAGGEGEAAETSTTSAEGGEAETSATGEIIYTVQPGDTLLKIGTRFGISWVAIAQANNIVNPDLIKAGQQLVIPSGTSAPPPDIVHVVRRGETLLKIAQMYGVSWQDIARYNQIGPPYIIYAGQTLLIPGDV